MQTNTQSLEKEMRYYFPTSDLSKVKEMADNTGLEFKGRFHEFTRMFDNPNESFTFYSKEIDGRLRFRVTTDTHSNSVSSKLSWKRRLPEYEDDEINIEEEVEVVVLKEDVLSMEFILEKILKCPQMSSYERFRNVYLGNGVELAIDEFPYGIMVEIEVKGGTEANIMNIINNSLFKKYKSSKKTCDDVYRELCVRDKTKESPNILFSDLNMPQIKD